MLSANESVLVALSGGPDSVALLAALATLADELHVRVLAAHLNHGLRGAESFRDEQYAAQVAAQLGVPCTLRRVTLSTSAGNLEECAREARYAFLEQVAREQGCTKIATGHSCDDQAETVLMRMMRGAGLDGLAAIHAVRDGWIIRPLLDCSRAEVLAFLEARGLSYCEDSSNLDRRFLRNRIRYEVLPLLESINPGVRERLALAASIAAVEARHLDDLLAPILAASVDVADGSLSLRIFSELTAGLHGRAIRLWLRQKRGHLRGLSAAHIDSIRRIAGGPRPNAQAQLPGRERVVREYDRLRFLGAPILAPFDAQPLSAGASVSLPDGWQIRAELSDTAAALVPDPAQLRCIADADALESPLTVRPRRPGDRVQPFGMVGHKKLQDLFVDRKVPLRLRRSTPVVEAAGEILWVPGLVRSNRALVSAATSRILYLVAERGRA